MTTEQATATSNPGRLTQLHPSLEQVTGNHFDHVTIAKLLGTYPIPVAGQIHINASLHKVFRAGIETLGKEIIAAVVTQTVFLFCPEAAGIVSSELALVLAHTRNIHAKKPCRWFFPWKQ